MMINGWDVVLSGATNYVDSVSDHNEIATMYEIEEIWDYLLG